MSFSSLPFSGLVFLLGLAFFAGFCPITYSGITSFELLNDAFSTSSTVPSLVVVLSEVLDNQNYYVKYIQKRSLPLTVLVRTCLLKTILSGNSSNFSSRIPCSIFLRLASSLRKSMADFVLLSSVMSCTSSKEYFVHLWGFFLKSGIL